VKIFLNQFSPEGIVVEEQLGAPELDITTDILILEGPVKIRALARQITNAVTVQMQLSARIREACSRCLQEFAVDLRKEFALNYAVRPSDLSLDLNQDIREEIILGRPIKTLCRPDCKGLCPKCGKNRNEGGCGCY
jgi:uncharacterized protein